VVNILGNIKFFLKENVIYKSLSNHSQEAVKTILSLYPKLKIFMKIRLIRPRIVGEKKLT